MQFIIRSLLAKNSKIMRYYLGVTASTLRSSTLGIVYSSADYGASVWLNSPHVCKIDTQLHNTTRMIASVIKQTTTLWLPVLSHIAHSKYEE